jgi:pyridoxine/pyridoxamine 5'-phosphate oxidase
VSAPTQPPVAPEFSTPPTEPLGLLRDWLDRARADGVRDPHHMALATADTRGRASNRTMAVIAVRDTGLVFASHADSPKGRDLAQTGWASGVLYWREVLRQVIVSGPVTPLPDDQSEALWAQRPIALHPMSVLSKQSAPLHDETALRAQAQQLGRAGQALARPTTWIGYLLEPASVEFWQSGDPDRLYQRLLFERDGSGWRSGRLQP